MERRVEGLQLSLPDLGFTVKGLGLTVESSLGFRVESYLGFTFESVYGG